MATKKVKPFIHRLSYVLTDQEHETNDKTNFAEPDASMSIEELFRRHINQIPSNALIRQSADNGDIFVPNAAALDYTERREFVEQQKDIHRRTLEAEAERQSAAREAALALKIQAETAAKLALQPPKPEI